MSERTEAGFSRAWPPAARVMAGWLLALGAAAFSAGAGEAAENLLARKGVRIRADSRLNAYAPDKAVDGNARDMASRWVSDDTADGHWLSFAWDDPVRFNQVTLIFWNAAHVAVDFDLEQPAADGWAAFHRVRGNRDAVATAVFPAVTAAGLRVKFLATAPDTRVRLYEIAAREASAPLRLDLSAAVQGGLLAAEPALDLAPETARGATRPAVRVAGPAEASGEFAFEVETRLFDRNTNREAGTITRKGVWRGADATVEALPVPAAYGGYTARITLRDAAGQTLDQRSITFFHLPAYRGPYRSSSPVGVHYHFSADTLARRTGFAWWRTHDAYGRWSDYAEPDGTEQWDALDARMDFVRRNGVRECFTLLGAPRRYSTIAAGEPVSSPRALPYSLYPPSDLEAWVERYLANVAARVRDAAPYRAYEVWNEPWSYFRLRGLRGTPAEAVELFRRSREALARMDPGAVVFAGDVKPEIAESPFAYRDFGRDLYELGYLRHTDVVAYHHYAMMTREDMDRLRRNAWDFGRDPEFWDTETAIEGRPHHRLLESMVNHRSFGSGKAFAYGGGKWAPFLDEGTGEPTMYLVALAALVRELGDALPLGVSEADGVRRHLFLHGGALAAVAFTDAETPTPHGIPVAAGTTARDVFGNALDPALAAPTRAEPLFIHQPDPAFARRALADELRYWIGVSRSVPARRALEDVVRGLNASEALPDAVVLRDGLRAARADADAEFLYATHPALDLLDHLRVAAERNAPKSEAPDPGELVRLRAGFADLWTRIHAKTRHEGILPDTERLLSRAGKKWLRAAEYLSDGDGAAAGVFLEAASHAKGEAERRLEREDLLPCYRAKLYFRGPKRFVRTETHAFVPGVFSDAMLTAANPFGRELAGELRVAAPEGWRVEPSTVPYRVAGGSRTLLPVRVAAPDGAKPGTTASLVWRDAAGHLPEIAAECEVAAAEPAFPALRALKADPAFTGN